MPSGLFSSWLRRYVVIVFATCCIIGYIFFNWNINIFSFDIVSVIVHKIILTRMFVKAGVTSLRFSFHSSPSSINGLRPNRGSVFLSTCQTVYNTVKSWTYFLNHNTNSNGHRIIVKVRKIRYQNLLHNIRIGDHKRRFSTQKKSKVRRLVAVFPI